MIDVILCVLLLMQAVVCGAFAVYWFMTIDWICSSGFKVVFDILASFGLAGVCYMSVYALLHP